MPNYQKFVDGNIEYANLHATDAITSDNGPITATAGDITATAGNVKAPAGNVTSGIHYLSTGAAPGAAAGGNNGSTPPAPVVAASATDARGNITFGSGGSAAAGAQVAVTFATAYGATPAVMVVPRNDATQQLGLYVTSPGTTGFTLSTHGAPTASQGNTTYSFDYLVLG